MKGLFRLGLRSAYLDIKNWIEWIRTVKAENADLQSKYHQFGMSHNFTHMIYLVVTLDEEDATAPDNVKKSKVIEYLAPVNRYLDEDLNFAEYLVPEFNQVVSDTGEPTLSYVIAYRFAFKTIGFWWAVKRLAGLAAIIYGLSLVNWERLAGLVKPYLDV